MADSCGMGKHFVSAMCTRMEIPIYAILILILVNNW